MPDLPGSDEKGLRMLRGILAAIGMIVMIVSGGCSLIALASSGQAGLGIVGVVLVVGGIPFGAGYLTWWLATRHERERKQRELEEKPPAE